jgi:hypothetical protein
MEMGIMKNGIIVSTRYADDIASLGLAASEVHEAWEWVIAFENGPAWGCFRMYDRMWFMRGLFDAPSISVTSETRGKGILKRFLYGRFANWFFRLRTDGSLVCSAEVGFGNGGIFVNNECIRFSARTEWFGKTVYSCSVCEVIEPGPRESSWRIIVNKDGQDMLAACIAYYFLCFSKVSNTGSAAL